MILKRLENNLANVLNSDAAVAICQAGGEDLKNLILLALDAAGVMVAETVTGDSYAIVTASKLHEGNLVGNVRKWTRQHGYEFFLKRTHERILTIRPNVFVFPNGRELQVMNVWVRASNFTHWGLSQQKTLPRGYVRL